jgi:type I restriction enzyme S subunit
LTLRLTGPTSISFSAHASRRRIVAKVNELMALCDELEAQITTTATTRRQLLEATLHEALGSGMAA